MSDFLVSASLYNLNQYCSCCSELECLAVDATWIEAALMVIYLGCFDEQSPASFPQLLLKGDISQSVEQDLKCLFQRKRKRKKQQQLRSTLSTS